MSNSIKCLFKINIKVVLLLLFLIPFVQAVPNVTSYWGSVTLDGLTIPNALVTVIDSSGNTVASATSDPNAQYAVDVYWNKLSTQTGESLTFKVNGTTATTRTIDPKGESKRLDLSASFGTVTRSPSSSTVAPEATVIITITPTNLPAGAYYTYETIPAGFMFVSTTANGYSNVGNVYTFKQSDTPTPFTYILKAPAATGTYTFSGTFKDTDLGIGTVAGASQITVTTTPTPTPILTSTPTPKTITVDDSGGADYTVIQDAINAANAGDTILVYSGTYFETVTVNKQLDLKGQDMPMINTVGFGDAITVTANGVTIDGFNVKTGSSSYLGIKVTSNNNVIINNNISNNNYGISLISSNNNIITGNIITGNTATSIIIGIKLDRSSNNTITGNNASNNDNGIDLYSSSNNNITGNNVNSNRYYGITLTYSSNNNFTGNNASNNDNGIDLYSSSNNNITGNNASNNNYGIYLTYSSNNNITGNTANSMKYGVKLDYSDNNNITGNTVNSNWAAGIELSHSSNNNITGNNASNNYAGIYLSYFSNNNNITVNNASNNGYSIYLGYYGNNNNITGNNASNNVYGIYLPYSSNNIIIGNSASNNFYGFYLFMSHYNELRSNTLNSNNNYGIYITSSIKNNISNNLLNNINNIYTDTPNIWNTTKTLAINIIGGSFLGGNFWANPFGTGFSQTCTYANNDGICDSPYSLDSYNIDYLPLAYNSTTPTPLVDSYLPPGATPAVWKAGVIRAMDDYFGEPSLLTKPQLISIMDAYFA